MHEREFSQNRTGRLVPATGATPDVKIAFVPDPLPPSKWKWPNKLYRLLIEARTRLASLDGTGKHLPNPEILLQPLQRREAQLSSKLEGTITDPQKQVLFEADPAASLAFDDSAFREVHNYRRALRLQLDGVNNLPLSLRLIRDLHQLLMQGVRGYDQRPGEFRNVQNQIGQPARFVPPPLEYLNNCLDAFEKYLHAEDDEFDPLVKAFLAHYQFETIHPFRDGNGRVGRLLLSLCIAEWCGLSNQWLYMSPYFEKDKETYMSLLFNVSADGQWEEWIKFCLEGVIQQSVDAEKRCDKLLALQKDFHERLKGGSVRLSRLVDSLFSTPVITVRQYVEMMDVTYPTARTDLKKLESAGIVEELPHMRNITLYCPTIYQITFEDI